MIWCVNGGVISCINRVCMRSVDSLCCVDRVCCVVLCCVDSVCVVLCCVVLVLTGCVVRLLTRSDDGSGRMC